MVALLNKDPDQRPDCNQLVQYFELPNFNESIDDLIYQEMEIRKAKYEQDCYEKRLNEQQFVQPANPCPKLSQQKIVGNKSGSSTNVTN